jgi:2-methylcitrate dehydratase PrpD
MWRASPKGAHGKRVTAQCFPIDCGANGMPNHSRDIVQFLAIKLWPGAHPFSGTVEAAMNAARDANVPPQEMAKILVAGPNRMTIGGSRRPRDLVEAIHSLPYFFASAVADKDFTWVHATEARIFNAVVTQLMDLVEVDPAPPAVTYNWGWSGRSRS